MRRICLALVCAAAVVAVAAGGASAAGIIRHVSTGGTDAGNCVSSPCRTIGYAVGQANPGDTVSVAAGTYAESVLVQKRLTLSGNGATVDATGHDNGILLDGAGSSGGVVRGFHVVNALFEGILAQNTSRVTIAGNELSGNDTGLDLDPSPCQGSLDDCGEALHLAAVTDSTVQGNYVHDNVGGILLTDDVGAPGEQPTFGPTSGNTIRDNRVLDNTKDCGITLASHFFRIGAPAAPNEAGVYGNLVLHNVSNGAGAAGIGVFAGPPGAAAWGNRVIGNVAMHNGLPGVAIHSHTAFQNADGNLIVNNTLADNGEDDDAGTGGPTGISVFSDVVDVFPPILPAAPIQHTIVAANRISDEQFGIFTVGAIKLSGLPSNKFDNVSTPYSIH